MKYAINCKTVEEIRKVTDLMKSTGEYFKDSEIECWNRTYGEKLVIFISTYNQIISYGNIEWSRSRYNLEPISAYQFLRKIGIEEKASSDKINELKAQIIEMEKEILEAMYEPGMSRKKLSELTEFTEHKCRKFIESLV